VAIFSAMTDIDLTAASYPHPWSAAKEPDLHLVSWFHSYKSNKIGLEFDVGDRTQRIVAEGL